MTDSSVAPTTRDSGLLLHITSLPGDYGIGDLGPEAHRFAADIAAAGQRYWQLLPVGPTGRGNSPYSSSSTFAGNPLLISPHELHGAGLLGADELEDLKTPEGGKVDYRAVTARKTAALRRAARRFPDRADRETRQRFDAFRAEHGALWLDDFCLYTVLRESHGPHGQDDQDLQAWKEPELLDRVRSDRAAEIETHRVIQFLFFEQWHSLKEKCRSHGVAIVGDLPLYVAWNSADVWAHPDNYLLDSDGRPTVVAGVPPDYFSETGQRWGNPIYAWGGMERAGFPWWRARVRHALSMFDLLRIDHFRGIAGYWEIPAGEPTAVTGRWRAGPGSALLRALKDEIDGLPLIAEDLGVITDDVIALRDEFGLPGMRVAQFGLDQTPDSSIHNPEAFPENVWAYTGTHDNDTTLGWFWGDNPRSRRWRLSRTRRRLHRALDGDIPWGVVEMVARSRAKAVVFPVQDILGLGTEARMNTPGTTEGNWEWRLRRGQLTEAALERLRAVTEASGRAAAVR